MGSRRALGRETREEGAPQLGPLNFKCCALQVYAAFSRKELTLSTSIFSNMSVSFASSSAGS
jgi:hypothetical protein